MKQYNLSADIVRVLAIIGVVIIHTANAVFARPDYFGGVSWWFAIFLDAISRAAVPLFIMLSGYFILHKNESLASSLKRTVNRILIPLIIWFVIYLLWNNGSPTLQTFNIAIISRLLTVNVFDLYFLEILLGLYIIAPILRAFLQTIDTTTKRNFVIGTVIIGCVAFINQFINHLCTSTDIFTYWLPYTGLFVVGYYLKDRLQIKTKPLFGIYILSLVVTMGGSYVYYLIHNSGNYMLDSNCLSYYSDSYLSINVVVMTICTFILIMKHEFNLPTYMQKLIYSLARCALGIYLVHTIYLSILDSQFHVFDHVHSLIPYLIIKFIVIFGLSYITVLGLINIPYIKKAFGEK